MQGFHIAETRAIVPVTRELAQLRYSLEDLIGPGVGVEESEGQRGRLSARRLNQLIPKAVLRVNRARKDLIELVLTYEGKMRVPEFISRERRYRLITFTVSSDIYWRPESGFCFIMDLPRRAVNAVTWMLSAAVLGYPGRLSSSELDSRRMQQAIRFLTKASRGGPGELVRAVFRDVEIDGNQLEEVNIRARELHHLPLYKDSAKGAGYFHAISFVTPLIEGIGRPLACRIDSMGSVQVYSPRLSDSELRALLNFFEEMLKR